MSLDEDRTRDYREAYERWQRDLQGLHRVLLDGEPLDPMHRVALLRSESHSHDRYEEARQRFLGLRSEAVEGKSPFDEDPP
ncbi:MAG: hypothetical protein ACR2PL_01275 [Dehalococcoidia bacterium]